MLGSAFEYPYLSELVQRGPSPTFAKETNTDARSVVGNDIMNYHAVGDEGLVNPEDFKDEIEPYNTTNVYTGSNMMSDESPLLDNQMTTNDEFRDLVAQSVSDLISRRSDRK